MEFIKKNNIIIGKEYENITTNNSEFLLEVEKGTFNDLNKVCYGFTGKIKIYTLKDNHIWYDGNMLNGLFHGNGKKWIKQSSENQVFFEDKTQQYTLFYEGEYKDGLEHGYGVQKLKYGIIYKGNFKDSGFDGKGSFECNFCNGRLASKDAQSKNMEYCFWLFKMVGRAGRVVQDEEVGKVIDRVLLEQGVIAYTNT